MKAFTPEISWHNRLPTLSLDFAPTNEFGMYRLATGGNDCRVYIWLIGTKKDGTPDIRIRAGLRRHQKSVGAVRFSSQQMLATGDDDGYIYLWKQRVIEEKHLQEQLQGDLLLNDDGFEDIESWQHHKVLRGHIEDICDLAWSKNGDYLLSGSVDNSAILWDAVKGIKLWCSDQMKGYVQGVAIDPHEQYLIALSTDRTLRVYNFTDRKQLSAIRRMNVKCKLKAIYCDDTVQTFCRRLEFSPDGHFLISPSCRLIEPESRKQQQQQQQQQQRQQQKESENNITDNHKQQEQRSSPQFKPINVFLVFKRQSIGKPFLYYDTGREPALCVRFSPVVYTLRESEQNFWGVPYRIVFAVATSRSVLIYDSQQPTPIAFVSQIHLARLTDLSWSHDGRVLMVSSYDGYTSVILFDKNEIGNVYTQPLLDLSPPEPLVQAPPPPPPKPAPEPMTIRKYLIKRT